MSGRPGSRFQTRAAYPASRLVVRVTNWGDPIIRLYKRQPVRRRNDIGRLQGKKMKKCSIVSSIM